MSTQAPASVDPGALSNPADSNDVHHAAAEVRPRTVIEPRTGWQPVNLGELWHYRELLFFLTWRDVKVRYKQTVPGAAWAIIQPVMTMIVFSVFFGRLGGMDRHSTSPYAVFVHAALLPWTFFAGAVAQAGQSLVQSTNLVSKVYFPRLFMPLAAIGGGLVDIAIALAVRAALMLGYQVAFGASLWLIPLFTLGTVLTATGVGALLAALVIAYRDFRHAIPFLLQLWMFASPVAYPLDVVPERWRLLYSLNPLVGMISGFRWAILGQPPDLRCVAVSLASAVTVLVVGVLYFRRVERRFADII